MMINKLNELNIFALRDLARRTGVSSPTSKKKEVLIKEIVEIMSGDKQPQINKTKQGRPPKVFGYDFSNVFNVQSISNGVLNQDVESYVLDDISTVAGCVELVNNNSALLWVNKNLINQMFFIPSDVVANQELRNGDRVVVELATDENQCRVKSVFSVNGCPVNQMGKRADYEMFSHSFKDEKIKLGNNSFGGVDVCLGENVYFYGDNNSDNTKTIIELMSACVDHNKIYINTSLTNKNKTLLQNVKNVEMFTSNITDEISISRRVVMLAIERAKRILEMGENCVVVVDDMLSVSGIDNGQLMKNLVSISMSTNNAGSISLFAVMPNNSLTQIEKLADRRYRIVNGELT